MVTEFGRYRAGMAGLLDEAVREVGKTEEWLDVAVNGDKASPQAVLKEDPMGAYRPYCALLLHKARLHMVAMLRANERNSIHSLAVQMRPILECAGQVVHIFHKLMVEPDREAGSRAVLEYANADYYSVHHWADERRRRSRTAAKDDLGGEHDVGNERARIPASEANEQGDHAPGR